MATGTIKWFNTEKGYGFIAPDEGGADVFVHISAVHKSRIADMPEGNRIRFNTEDNRGRKAAVNLQLID